MPVADVHDNRITVSTLYHERHLMQLIPGARYTRDMGCWTVPLGWPSCIVLRSLFGDDLKVQDGLAAWARELHERRIAPATALSHAMELSPEHPLQDVLNRIEARQEASA